MKKSRFPNLFILSLLVFLSFFTYYNYDEIKEGFNKLFTQTIDIINKSDLASITSEGSLVNDVSDLEDSGVTIDGYEFDTEFYPYYGMLNNNERTVYKQVYANAIEYETTFLPSVALSVKEASRAIEAVYNDHPELFWVNTSYTYKYNKEDKCVQIILNFNNTIDYIELAKSNFAAQANKVISLAETLNTDYEKEKYVHDKLVDLLDYDVEAPLNQSAYSALVGGSTVCAGYTRAFQYIMTQLGIPTYYVFGTAEGDHAWNIVKLDGEYYNVDVTWDDAETKNYLFFNVDDSKFQETHTRLKESNLLPACNGSKYSDLEEKIIKSKNVTDASVYQEESTNDNWWEDLTSEIP